MKKSLLMTALLIATALGLSACPKGPGFNHDNVASFQLTQMKSIDDDLQKKGIAINSEEDNTTTDTNDQRTVPKALKAADLDQIHDELVRFTTLGDGVVSNVTRSGSPQREAVLNKTQNRLADANEWLKKVDARRAQLRAQAQAGK